MPSLGSTPPLSSVRIDNEGTENMKLYIGTKAIMATPMKRLDYNNYRGWTLPADENGSDEGFLVEYRNSESNHPDHDGYISWSPSKIFHQSYKPFGEMSFSEALTAMKQGYSMARKGWNGKGMYLYLVPENRYAPTTPAGHAIAKNHEDGLVPYGAYIAMKTAQNNVVPWLASQTDVLADDWEVLPE